MNSSATAFIRACRARPAAQQHLLRARSKSTAVRSQGPETSSTARSSLPSRSNAQLGRRAFFTASRRYDAQPVNDIPSAASGGLDAASLEKSSDNGSTLPQSILSRASTDASSPSTITTTTNTTAALDTALLPSSLTASDLLFLTTTPTHTGTVTRTSTMSKTVRVTRSILHFHAAFQKHYTRHTHSLVHDPHNLLAEGDVISYGAFPPSLRHQRDKAGKIVVKRHRPKDRNGVVKELGVRYLVREIVSPFGMPLEMRQGRDVGGIVGRWKGTDGEVKKIPARQKGRKDGAKAKAKTTTKKNVGAGDGEGDAEGKARQAGKKALS